MSTVPSKELLVSVNIVFPTANSNVTGGGNFVTYGYVNPDTSTMTAWVMDGKTKIDGEETDPPVGDPEYDWAFAFEGVPTGRVVQLTVKGVSGMNNDAPTINITCVT